MPEQAGDTRFRRHQAQGDTAETVAQFGELLALRQPLGLALCTQLWQQPLVELRVPQQLAVDELLALGVHLCAPFRAHLIHVDQEALLLEIRQLAGEVVVLRLLPARLVAALVEDKYQQVDGDQGEAHQRWSAPVGLVLYGDDQH
ncbi:hypothetical protein [Microbulbifer taiwanensis]|uniref:hypothetical protein n=1 Tax=Microbulbifer taiwanensis TaxID=986746 RepID=UPI00360CC66F